MLPERVHTLTVNASHDNRQGVTGIGIVIQERQGAGRRGPIVAQLSESHRDAPPGAAEAFAILRAFEIALARGYSHVKVRSVDNQKRKQLRAKHRDSASTPDPVCAKILELARQFTWVQFDYVPRRKNQLARKLAREARLAAAIPATGVADGREHGAMFRSPSSSEADRLIGDWFAGDDFSDDDLDEQEIPF